MDPSGAGGLAGEGDPLDLQLRRLGVAPTRVPAVPWHVRLGISWSAGEPPVVLLLLIGVALGPRALSILTPNVLSAIDPAIPVALAAIGVHVGLNLRLTRSPLGRRLLAGATVESLITGVLVAAGTLLLLSPDPRVASLHAWLMALCAGVCASMSAPLPETDVRARTPAAELRIADVIAPTVLGGMVLAWLREGPILDAALLFLQAVALAFVVAVAAWLLLAHATSDTEERIFGISTLLLLGGLADYLSVSALLSGLVAGVFWRLVGGNTGESIQRDVGYLRHPLVVLLLVVAGARASATAVELQIVLAYLVLRTIGKLAGGWSAVRVSRADLPADLGWSLLTPGVFGVAFAMNVVRAAGPPADLLLPVVALGTIASQVLSALRRPPGSGA